MTVTTDNPLDKCAPDACELCEREPVGLGLVLVTIRVLRQVFTIWLCGDCRRRYEK